MRNGKEGPGATDPPTSSGRATTLATHERHRKTSRGISRAAAYWAAMGFNPFRQQRRSNADYLMVAGALLVCAALVIWALLG